MSKVRNNINNNKNSNNKESQIPTDQNLEQTEVLDRQSTIKGMERDDELVHHFPKAASLAQMLKGLDFPVDKKQIIHFLQEKRHQQQSSSNSYEDIQAILNLIIEKLPDQEQKYENVFEVAEEAKLVDTSTP